jgi:hypothetical protein
MAWGRPWDITGGGPQAARIALENLALRQQLAVWKARRPGLASEGHSFRDESIAFKPETTAVLRAAPRRCVADHARAAPIGTIEILRSTYVRLDSAKSREGT